MYMLYLQIFILFCSKDEVIDGPAIEFNPSSNMILFNTPLYKEHTKVLEITNKGTTAVLLQFENVEQKFVK